MLIISDMGRPSPFTKVQMVNIVLWWGEFQNVFKVRWKFTKHYGLNHHPKEVPAIRSLKQSSTDSIRPVLHCPLRILGLRKQRGQRKTLVAPNVVGDTSSTCWKRPEKMLPRSKINFFWKLLCDDVENLRPVCRIKWNYQTSYSIMIKVLYHGFRFADSQQTPCISTFWIWMIYLLYFTHLYTGHDW